MLAILHVCVTCRYHGSSAAAKAALPYDAGFESVGVVVAAAPDVAAGRFQHCRPVG